MISSSDIDQLTKLVIVNAIYFFGNWVKQFDEKLTTKKYFWVQPNDSILVPMMEQTHYFLGGADSIAQFIELPYKGNMLSMFIILPNKGIELEKIEKNMTLEKLETWTTKLSSIKWHLSLPKYEFKTDIDLKNNLKKLGMSDAFNSRTANFSGMDGTRNLHISKALHQAYIKVNEKGTEAAAATALVLIYVIEAEPREFNINCPFLFIIKENSTGSILFIGRVTNPTK